MAVKPSAVIGAVALAGALAFGASAAGEQPAHPPAPRTPSVYELVNRCFAMRAPNGDFVARTPLLGYRATATASAALRFRMQATALGRYLLYAADARMPAVGLLGDVAPTAAPGPPADWTVAKSGAGYTFTALTNGRRLTVGALDRLVLSTGAATPFELVPATGCATFPEIDTNVVGRPVAAPDPDGPVTGLIDTHIHVTGFRLFGGGFHCGRPWSPYGVTVALRDCADHRPNGALAVVENFLSTGSPIGTHSPDGWPSFTGWPRPESLSHEGTYWKWIERAWRGGLRIMVSDVVENGALCDLYPIKGGGSCDEMESARRQIDDLHALQDYIDAQSGGPGKGWFRIVLDPTQARRVINEGKLAVVLGIEVSEVLGCGHTNETPHCDTAQIDAELDDLWDRGVRSLFPVHKFDNALGGTHYDEGATGVLVNAGNRWRTGEFWEPEPCPGAPEHDNEPTNLLGPAAAPVWTILGPLISGELLSGTLPVYPPGPLCNPEGLSPLGEHLIERMIAKGMIIETDHLSVRARDDALDVVEEAGYSGLVTSHTWGDTTSTRRLMELGGFVGGMAHDSTSYGEYWQEIRAMADPDEPFGIGFGSDINGLAAQGQPRAGAVAAGNPVVYPFESVVGDHAVHRQRSGTRVYDINDDGVAHYGLYLDWVEDLRKLHGDEIVEDLTNGAEAYLQMWERATSSAGVESRRS